MKTTKLLSILVLALGLATVSLAAEGIWTTRADMPTRRYVLSSSVVDGKIYAIGGASGGPSNSATVQEYDPVTDTWTRKADMPTARGAGASSAVNGRIYAIGGGSSISAAHDLGVQEYDVATDTWTAKANMPTPRGWLSTSVVDGKIYAIGGALTYQGTVFSTVEEYDPVTDTWTSKADMPTPRACVSTSAVNGKIYAIGGNLSSPWYRGLSTVEEYDPGTNTWTKKADMPTGRTYFSTSVLNGKIYAIGGLTTGNNHLSPVEEYDPATNTWTRKADMPTARSGLATSAVNGKIYAIGGWVGSSTVLTTVEEYDLTAPPPDFNGDEIVDIDDLLILIEHWGTDEPLCDIGPTPFGDGIVDVQDLEVLMSYWGQEFLTEGLIAYWRLDETEGSIAYDSVGGLDGSLYGEPFWQPDGGMIKGALEFDGVDDYISTPLVLDTVVGPFSVFAWVKGGMPGQVIFSQAGRSDWLLADAANGILMTEFKFLFKPDRRPLQSQTVITDGNWHRVGLVWDSPNRILYVDDVEVASDTCDKGSLFGGLQIGAGKNLEAGSFWSGLIDDVRIYNRAVTP